MMRPTSGLPVKAILSTSGMLDEGGAGLAEAGDDVDDAVRDAGFEGELADAQRGERRLLGGLEDDGAAAGEGGRQLPAGHHDREVPGDDLADDADGLAQEIGEHRAADGDGLAVDLVGPAGVVLEAVDGGGDVDAEAVGDRLAGIDGVDLGELLAVVVDELAELVDELAAIGGVHGGPLREGGAGGLDGAINVFGGTFSNAGDGLAGGGVGIVVVLAGSRLHPSAVDEELCGGGDAGADVS